MMKASTKLLLLVCATLLLSCEDDYHCGLTTTVHQDGSFTREYALRLDSAQLISGRVDNSKNMVQLSGPWKLTWTVKGDSTRHPLPMDKDTYQRLAELCRQTHTKVEDTVVVYAMRHFASAHDMAKGTRLKVGTLTLTPNISFKKSYRFFCTTYQYKETYPGLSHCFAVPLSQYFTKEEIGYWFSGHPDLTSALSGMEADDVIQRLKAQYSKWIAANDFEITYQTLLAAYSEAGPGALPKRQFRALHDKLMASYIDECGEEAQLMNKADWLRTQLHTDAYTRILNDNTLMRKVTEQESNFMALSMLKIDYQLFMPSSASQPALSTRLLGSRLFAGSATLSSSATVSHTWTYVFIILVLLAALIGLIIVRHRR
ncbi:MAG: hypothetical protein SPL43_02160 [Prevotella sp.]|nr:hypothetical protein [Prevotella sp.]